MPAQSPLRRAAMPLAAWAVAALAPLATAAAPAAAAAAGAGSDELALLQVQRDVHGAQQRAATNASGVTHKKHGPSAILCCGDLDCGPVNRRFLCELTFDAYCNCNDQPELRIPPVGYTVNARLGSFCPDNCPADTVDEPSCEGESCSVFADPHVSTFDAAGRGVPDYLAMVATEVCAHRPVDVNAYEAGDFWIVKARDVQIQGRFVYSKEFVPDRAAVGAVMVSGPLIEGKRLLLEPMNGRVAWDGQPLDPVRLDANRTDGLLALSSCPGPQPGSSRVEAALPHGVRLTVVRFGRHLDMNLKMPKALGSRDGLCGNGNGAEEDDAEEAVQARLGSLAVTPDELLFEGSSSA